MKTDAQLSPRDLIKDFTMNLTLPRQSECRRGSGLQSSAEAGKIVELQPAGSLCCRLSRHLTSTALHQSRNQSEM